MLQYRFIELAKQGNSKAIAALLNGKLHPQGINAKVNVINGWLHILLEADELPDRIAMINVVRNQLIELAPESIKRVKLLVKKSSDDYATWGQEFDLQLSSFSGIILPGFPEHNYGVSNKTYTQFYAEKADNQGGDNFIISQITLGIVVVILFIALLVFMGKILVKRSPQIPHNGTTYPQALPKEQILI